MSCVPLNSQQKMDSSGNIPACSSHVAWVFSWFCVPLIPDDCWNGVGRGTTIGFIHQFKKKKKLITWWPISWSCDERNQWIFPTIREGPSWFFASCFWECRTLSSKIQFKICYREGFERSKIYHMDKISLELVTIEEFVTAVLQTVAKRCLSSCDHFFKYMNETVASNCLKKAISKDSWDQ